MSETRRNASCEACQGEQKAFDLHMAFQPIFDVETGQPFAFEALVRGASGQGAADVLGAVKDEDLYAFDQQCRVAAIRQSVDRGILETDALLSINFLPNAVYSPKACIQLTLKTARETGLPLDRLMFEFTENERIESDHLQDIIRTYADMGFKTAIDDFGAGMAGLELLADLKTSHLKIDMALIRGMDRDERRRTIVTSIVHLARDLGVDVIAEGIETKAELEMLKALGVRLVQGYLLAMPILSEPLSGAEMPTSGRVSSQRAPARRER